MTILYMKDWYNPDGSLRASVHTESKNKTFRRTAMIVKQMGVKNYAFMMSIYDQGLRNIDPHALNDTNDPTGSWRKRVALECYRNLWYFLRECVRIPVEGASPIPYELHRGNLAMGWCFANSFDFSSTQPRQTGKALTLDSLILTPDGWKRMGDMAEGDTVITPDGDVASVVGVYPQGMRKVHKVMFEDGRISRCDGEHLWKVKSKKDWDVLDTNALITKMKSGETFCVPLATFGDSGKESSAALKAQFLEDTADGQHPFDADGFLTVGTLSHSHAISLQKKIWSAGGICKRTCVDGVYILKIKFRDDVDALKIVSIEDAGFEETQCIEVDHPDHLYITNDFVVTHNTVGAVTNCVWMEYIRGFKYSIGMLTHNSKLVRDNVKRMKTIRDALPPYLINQSKDDVDNKEGLSYAAFGNEYKTYIGVKDRAAADNVGRGATSPMLHVDEIGFIANIKITFEVIMGSTNQARENAKRNGQIYGNIYTTTAADPMTESGRYAFEFIDSAMPFTEKLYDSTDRADAKRIIDSNSKNGVVNGTFSYRMLGKTDEWFYETIRRNNVSPDGVLRDYLNQWISAAKNPILRKDSLQKMNESKMAPTFTEMFNEFVVSWYIPKDIALSRTFRTKPLILGMDSAEGVGRDFTAFVCIDPKDLSVVFTFRCNDANTQKIALLAARFLFEFPRMIFCPERKNTGVGITDSVTDSLRSRGLNPFQRIFNGIVQEKGLKEGNRYDPYDASLADTFACRKKIGFMTTGVTRNVLYQQILQRVANLAADRVRDINLVNEMGALQHINNRIDHTQGNHDDTAIAYLLACYVVLEGRNLHYYGLTSDDIMSPQEASATKNDVLYLKGQIALRRRIREIEEKITKTSNETLIRALECQARQLRTQIDDNVAIEPVSADVVRRELSEYNELVASSRDKDVDMRRPYTAAQLMSIY